MDGASPLDPVPVRRLAALQLDAVTLVVSGGLAKTIASVIASLPGVTRCVVDISSKNGVLPEHASQTAERDGCVVRRRRLLLSASRFDYGSVDVDVDDPERLRPYETLLTAALTTIAYQLEAQRLASDGDACIARATADRELAAALTLDGTIVASMAEGVQLTRTADGVIIHTNQQFDRMFGYERGGLVGQHVSVLNAASDVSPVERAREITASLQLRGMWEGELENVRADGTPFWCHASVSTFQHPEHGEIWVSVHYDITDRKRLEAAVSHARRMEAVGRLAGGVAHDFNNMMQAIISNVDLALLDAPAAGTVRDCLDEIYQCAQRSASVTRQLLAYAQKQIVRPKVLDVNGSVAVALDRLRRLVGEQIELVWRPGPLTRATLLDPLQLDEILVNLCTNAREAIGGGGRIVLETAEVREAPGDSLAEACLFLGPYVRLSVMDNGPGMSTDVLEHVFEPFFTTKAVGTGPGLGLATVHGIALQNLGFVRAESTPGGGAAFHVYLPCAVESSTTTGAG